MAFKVGDKVEHQSWGLGEIAFGPFEHFMGPNRYLMREEGSARHIFAEGDSMKPAAKFKVGDKVRGEYSGGVYTIKSGPYFNRGNEWYVTETESGDVTSNSACDLSLVESADTYAYSGVTYDLSATYNDRDDEPWTFKRFGDEVRGGCNGYAPSEVSEPLESVVGLYGPLTRV
jgi:hypothetical protein